MMMSLPWRILYRKEALHCDTLISNLTYIRRSLNVILLWKVEGVIDARDSFLRGTVPLELDNEDDKDEEDEDEPRASGLVGVKELLEEVAEGVFGEGEPMGVE